MRWLLAALIILCASAASAAPTASCSIAKAYRTGTTLTSPAYIYVDCSGTTDSDSDIRPFHDLSYVIDFDDADCSSGQGQWGRGWLKDSNQAPRNYEFAPAGAHVYECAGTFDVLVVVTGQDGTQDTWTEQLTVESEDSGWPSGVTKCVSDTGSFTGCPSGATQATSSDFDAELQTGAGTRTLYRGGGSFTMSAGFTLTDGTSNGSLVGSFGTGRANVNATFTGNNDASGGWRWRDLIITRSGAGDQAGGFHSVAGEIDKFLMLRVDELETGNCGSHSIVGTSTNQNEMMGYVDFNCEQTKTTGTHWVNGFFAFNNSAIIGSRFYANSTDSVGQRMMGTPRSIWAHNTYHFDGAGNALTLHWRSAETASGRNDLYVVIRDMRLHDEGDESLRNMVLQSLNTGMKSDYIVESIFATYGTNKGLVSVIAAEGTRLTFRNIIADLRGLGSQTGTTALVWIDPTINPGNDEVDIHLYNSTVIRAGTSAVDLYAIDSQTDDGTGHIARNVLLYDETSTNNATVGGTSGLTNSNIVHLNGGDEGCPFTGTDGACTLSTTGLTMDPNEFKIRASGGSRASVVNAGFDFPDTSVGGRQPFVFRDAYMGCRGGSTSGPDSEWDIGAHEYGSTPCSASAPSGPGSSASGTFNISWRF